jgi:hypothetical protein
MNERNATGVLQRHEPLRVKLPPPPPPLTLPLLLLLMGCSLYCRKHFFMAATCLSQTLQGVGVGGRYIGGGGMSAGRLKHEESAGRGSRCS